MLLDLLAASTEVPARAQGLCGGQSGCRVLQQGALAAAWLDASLNEQQNSFPARPLGTSNLEEVNVMTLKYGCNHLDEVTKNATSVLELNTCRQKIQPNPNSSEQQKQVKEQ